MSRKGWFGEKQRHILAGKGIKTGTFKKTMKAHPVVADESKIEGIIDLNTKDTEEKDEYKSCRITSYNVCYTKLLRIIYDCLYTYSFRILLAS